MHLISVNVSMPKPISFEGRNVLTGIFKQPVEGRLHVESFEARRRSTGRSLGSRGSSPGRLCLSFRALHFMAAGIGER